MSELNATSGSNNYIPNKQPIVLSHEQMPGYVETPGTLVVSDSTPEALAKLQLSTKEQKFITDWNSKAFANPGQAVRNLLGEIRNISGDKGLRLYKIFEQIRTEGARNTDGTPNIDTANAFRDQVLQLAGEQQLKPEEFNFFADSTTTVSDTNASAKSDGIHEKAKTVAENVSIGAKYKGSGGTSSRAGFKVIKGFIKTLIPNLIDSESGGGMDNYTFEQAAVDTGSGFAQAGLIKAFGTFSKSVLGKTFIGSAVEVGTSGIINKSFMNSDNPSLRKFGLLNTARAGVQAGAGAAAFVGTEAAVGLATGGTGAVVAYGMATGLASGASELAGIAFDKLTSEDQQVVAINIVTDLCAMNGIKFSADLKETAKSPEDARRIADLALAIENNPALMQALKDCGIDTIHMDNVYALSPNMIMNMIGEAKAQGGTNAMMRFITGGKGINVNMTTAGVKKYSDPATNLRGTITTYSMEIGTKKVDHYVIREDKIETQKAGQEKLLETVRNYQMEGNTAFNTVDAQTIAFLSSLPNAKFE